MATINPRINITITSEIAEILSKRAAGEKASISKIALDLIKEAIERDEDVYYSTIAEKREKKTKKWLTHSKAWE